LIQLRLREGYCIDTSALIDLHTNHYPPDIFPGLWKDLEFLVDQGLLIAPDEVFQEIRVKDDELAKWGKSNKKMFIPLDSDQIWEVSAILEKFPGLVDRNKTIPDADPFLIALAKCRAWTVVTSERPSNSSVRPKIPNVCKSLNVRWIKLLEFFREIELKYK
jgi:hypothetical protein